MKSSLTSCSILIVDDEPAIRMALDRRFREEGAETTVADTVKAAERALAEASFDLLVLDHRLPDGTGLDLLEKVHRRDPSQNVVMMTAYSSAEDAVRAMKAGAHDYVMKPFDLDEMVVVAQRALDHQALRTEVARYRAAERADNQVTNLIGDSPAMQDLRDFIGRVAQSGARTILIRGESGTGKDLVARAIHFASDESDRPFLNITCTALPEGLLESELFGHERGAFTDAKKQKKGLFEEANGGTIFLDEIGDMPMSLQGKLLRFLEAKKFRRVGGNREITVDVRVVAATNRNLQEAIEAGHFRNDLYYRLNVIPVEIAPLRERLEDVPQLVAHFCEQYAAELKRPAQHFDEEALTLMGRYAWPGNVRELKNCVERAVLLGRGTSLGVADLPREVRGECTSGHIHREFRLPAQGLVLETLIRDLLDQALEASAGNKSRAAGLLGIHRDQVRYWVKKYGLTRWIRTRPRTTSSSANRS